VSELEELKQSVAALRADVATIKRSIATTDKPHPQPSNMPERTVYRYHEAAAFLGVSKSTILRYVANGEFTLVKITKRLRGIPASEVHARAARSLSND
jgi:excisionase family DNA binding protein